MTTIAIITPWHNQHRLVDGYLDAVSSRRPGDELIVVDNASDPPIEFAALRLDYNAGFVTASNAGLDQATTDAVLFLNNDVAATDPGWLDRIRDAIEPGVLVGASLNWGAHAKVDGRPLPYLEGWCLAGTRDDLRELGGFDQSFYEPAYFGDNDLCLRARAAGMRLRETRVGLVHLGNATAGPATGNPAVQAATRANFQRYARRARDLLAAAA